MTRAFVQDLRWLPLVFAIPVLVMSGCSKKDKAGETASIPDTTRTAPATDPGRFSRDPVQVYDLAFLRTQPSTPEIEIAFGNTFLSQSAYDSAIVHYRRAADLDPKNAAAWNFVGICYGRMNRLEDAEASYEKAISIDALYPKTHVNLGTLYLRRNQLDKSIAAYKVAASIDSTDATNWLNLGLAYEKKGWVNEAILAYGKASKFAPQNPEPWERLGWIYYEQKLYYAARERWREAVNRDPSRADLEDNIQRLQAYAESTGSR